jgi:alpha-D-xyloside xylohydrolase
MHEAHTALTPIMRGMFYEFPGDANCLDLKDQYMFGPDYLVAPVLEPGARSRSVYLPEGSWEDVENGQVYEGGQRITVDAPLEKIPVFKRL